MSIQEIGVSDTEFEGEKLHDAWEMRLLDNVLYLEQYGNFCHWYYIRLMKDKEEVYRITIDHRYEDDGRKDVGEREEFFFGEHFRKYTGDQFSFVEYVWKAAELEKIPEPGTFVRMGLEGSIEESYHKNLKRILES